MNRNYNGKKYSYELLEEVLNIVNDLPNLLYTCLAEDLDSYCPELDNTYEEIVDCQTCKYRITTKDYLLKEAEKRLKKENN